MWQGGECDICKTTEKGLLCKEILSINKEEARDLMENLAMDMKTGSSNKVINTLALFNIQNYLSKKKVK